MWSMRFAPHISLVVAVGGLACTSRDFGPCGFGPAQVVALDASLPDGGTPGDVLARAQGIRQGWFEWFDRSTDFQVVPPAGRTTFEMEVVATDTTARFFPGSSQPGQGRIACPERIEIDTAVRFVTADGGLMENWLAPLAWTASDIDTGILVDLYQHRPAGSFSAAYIGNAPVDTSSLWFRARINRETASGRVDFWASASRGNSGTGFGTDLASWMSSP